MSLRAQVESAIGSQLDRDGVTVVAPGGKVLATRPALEGGAHVVLVMPPEGAPASSQPTRPAVRGNPHSVVDPG